jgi:aspartate aminotransferase-like enzyme
VAGSRSSLLKRNMEFSIATRESFSRIAVSAITDRTVYLAAGSGTWAAEWAAAGSFRAAFGGQEALVDVAQVGTDDV